MTSMRFWSPIWVSLLFLSLLPLMDTSQLRSRDDFIEKGELLNIWAAEKPILHDYGDRHLQAGAPSGQPTSRPSSLPSGQPTMQPSTQPSSRPSSQPSSAPTSQPSVPTSVPTSKPSGQPTKQPTGQPSAQPSSRPSAQPSGSPTCLPSSQPSSMPSTQPSSNPSGQPTSMPTNPTSRPSSIPTSIPTETPNLSTQVNLLPWQPILYALLCAFFLSCAYLLHTYLRKTQFSVFKYVSESIGWRDRMEEAREKKRQEHLKRRRVAPLVQVEEARKFKQSREGEGGGIAKRAKLPLSRKVFRGMSAGDAGEGDVDPPAGFAMSPERAISMPSVTSPRSEVSTPRSTSVSSRNGRRIMSYDLADEESKSDSLRPVETTGASSSPGSSSPNRIRVISNLFGHRKVVKSNKVEPAPTSPRSRVEERDLELY